MTGFLVGVLLVVNGDRRAERDESERDEAWKSFEWWYAQRAYPYEMIPQGAYQKAWAYLSNSMPREQRSGLTREESAGTWTSLGPTNIGGRILGIAVDPTSPNIVWAGAASGGLWKSTTGGEGVSAWSYVQTGFNVLSVSAVAIDPSNPNIMYIGTGEISLYHRPLVGTPGARASYGMGILRSTDRGGTWSQTGLLWTFPQITAVEKIVINPANPRTVYAATSEGTFKSTDRGASWSQTHDVLMAMDLIMSPGDTSTLFVACGSLNSSPNPGIYRTTDAGGSWTQLAGGLPDVNFGRTALAVSAADPMTIYAGVSDAATRGIIGLYKSSDGGNNWTSVSTVNYVGIQGWYNNVIAAHPQSPDTVFCGGIDIYKSTSGGSNLTDISYAWTHVDQHAIAFDPSNPAVIYFGSDGGVYKTSNGGLSFIDCNKGLVTTQFYPGFANSPTDASLGLGGLQDNGTLKYSGTTAWLPVLGADGGWCAIDPTNDSILYAEEQYLNLYKSLNSGGAFFPINNNLPSSSENSNFIAPFVIVPSAPAVLYAGTKTVYKTTNGGNAWFPTNGGNNLNGTNVACIGVSWTSPDTLLAATGSGALGETPLFQVFSSTNGGATWVNVTGSLPNRYPTEIEFDPEQSSAAYMTFSGYGTPHVYRTTDLGAHWTNISSNLPDIPHQTITVDPEHRADLYVGTDLGVFHSSNGGAAWGDFSDGMPPAMVLDLTVSRSDGRLRASTFGNGVYERKLVRTPVLSLVSPNGGEVWVAGMTESILWTELDLDYVKLEYSTDDGAAWTLIAAQTPAAPGEYDWTLPMVAATSARVRITDAVGGLASDVSAAPFTILLNPDITQGWNMLSLPVRAPDPRKTALYPNAASDAYQYRGSYVPLDTIPNGIGYWIKFNAPQMLNLTGDPISTDTVTVRPGWNLIGSVTADISTAAVQEIPPGIITSSYFGYLGGYIPSSTINHGHGYWVKTLSDGKLILGSAGASSPKRQASAVAADRGWNEITLTDARGYSQTLYFTGTGDTSLAHLFEMPPPGPEGVFDVRFQGTGMLGILTRTTGIGQRPRMELPIMIQGGEYPIHVRWHTREAGGGWSIAANGSVVAPTLGSEGSIQLKEAMGQVTLRGEADNLATVPPPGAAQLYDSYPNPFNPSTTVRYSVPERAKVLVQVFDVRGEEVTTLVASEQDEGIHSVLWDARGRASGIYFVRLTEFSLPGALLSTDVKKVLLIR